MGNRLREIRKKKKITQYELGAKIHVAPPFISMLENGWTGNEEIRKKVARGLGVPVRELFPTV